MTGEDELLVNSGGPISTPDWSPDGRTLIYTDSQDLWTLSLDGDRQPSVFHNTKYMERRPAFSPADARWVAFESNETGRTEISVLAFPGKQEQSTVSRNGGRAPHWRADGRELFFLAPDGTLMSAAIAGGPGFHAGVPRPLFQTGLVSTQTGRPYLAAENGQRFLIPVRLEAEDHAPVSIVLNWPALLPK